MLRPAGARVRRSLEEQLCLEMELAVLASLVDEQDGVAPFDLDDRAIAEFNRPANSRVELEERRSSPSHMVCCPCVEDPSPVLMLLVPLADLSEHSLLLQLNWLSNWCLCYAQLELGFDAH